MTTKTTYKVGDKVRVIDADGIKPNAAQFKNGEIAKITASSEHGVVIERKSDGEKIGVWTSELGCIELAPQKSTKNQRISALEKEVETLKVEIETLKAAQKPPVTVIADAIKRYKERTPNQKRKAIIDEAKAFVEDVQKRNYRMSSTPAITSFQKSVFFGQTDELVFHVNAEKRTVVAIIRTISGKHVVHKGIAKCNPSDIFNADIGKAIALGRALGLDVERFEKTVQPTEFEVGQIALCGRGKPYTITEVREDRGMTKPGTFHWKSELRSGVVKITNDTEAQY